MSSVNYNYIVLDWYRRDYGIMHLFWPRRIKGAVWGCWGIWLFLLLPVAAVNQTEKSVFSTLLLNQKEKIDEFMRVLKRK